jgi:diaminopimelate decarboxylase
VTVSDAVAAFGSPLWRADLDGARDAYRDLSGLLDGAWDDTVIAYSFKTNRLLALLVALTDAGAHAEVVCDAEYALARDILALDGDRIIVNGPAKTDALLTRAARDGALVMCDAPEEVDRAVAAGVARIGFRVRCDGALGATSRFGICPHEVAAAAGRVAAAGLSLEALGTHVVSTDVRESLDPTSSLAGQVRVLWPRGPRDHIRAAQSLARIARELWEAGYPRIGTLDLGGGLPAPDDAAGHVDGIVRALRADGFDGRLVVEPGRALVAAAVDLVCTVIAVKRLDDGRRAVVVDAGTNHVPGALWQWPTVRSLTDGPSAGSAMVCGPLCLNIDILHPAVDLPDVNPGDLIVIEGVGAYAQSHATQFGDVRPAVMARDGGRWRLARRREDLSDLIGPELPAGIATGRLLEEGFA